MQSTIMAEWLSQEREVELIQVILEGARASTGLCVDVSSGVMKEMKVIRICSRSQ